MRTTNAGIEFTTLSVTPDFRDKMREQRDELGFNSYEELLREMQSQFDPSDEKRDLLDGDVSQ